MFVCIGATYMTTVSSSSSGIQNIILIVIIQPCVGRRIMKWLYPFVCPSVHLSIPIQFRKSRTEARRNFKFLPFSHVTDIPFLGHKNVILCAIEEGKTGRNQVGRKLFVH